MAVGAGRGLGVAAAGDCPPGSFGGGFGSHGMFVLGIIFGVGVALVLLGGGFDLANAKGLTGGSSASFGVAAVLRVKPS